MQYRHVRTGAVIDVTSVIIDKEWEPYEAPAPAVKKESTEKPAAKKRATKK